MIRAAFILVLFFVSIQYCGSSRFINRDHDSNPISDGDGILHQKQQSIILPVGDNDEVQASSVTCEPTYGFLPCTTKVWGNLFLLVVYQYLLTLSDKYISKGSNLFFRTFGTGIFGGSLFYALAIFPQLLLILVSVLSTRDVQLEFTAAISMGILAGSTITSLTIVWGCVIVFGSYDLSQTTCSSIVLENKSSFFLSSSYGAETDARTKYTARIMLLSTIPFLILQLAKVFNSPSATRVGILVSLVTTVAFLVFHATFQVFQPWIQDRTLDYLILSYMKKNMLQSLCDRKGKPNETKIRELFCKMDQNNDKQLSGEEVRAFLLGIEAEGVGLIEESCVSKVMEEFDVSGDHYISETEFLEGMSKWINKANGVENNQDESKKKFLRGNSKEGKDEDKLAWLNYSKATYFILIGMAIGAVLAQPLVQTLADFATATNIPTLLVSYFMVPLALNFRQGYSAIISVRDKTVKSLSLTLSQIYDEVFMNNVLGLAIFLALVYVRDVAWDVSAEILVVLIICAAVGLSTSFFSKFPFWTSLVAFALYPISLATIYVLTTFLGWG